jgi:hypothetical protein
MVYGPIFILLHPLSNPPLLHPWRLPIVPDPFFPYSLSLIGPFPLAFLPQALYNPSTFHLCHFRPEDGDSMFLRNVGIDLRNHTAPHPRQHQHHANRRENLKSHIFDVAVF